MSRRQERVISLPNLAGGYSLTLSSKDSNTLVIRLVPDEDNGSADSGGFTIGGDGGGGGGGGGDVNANDSFDSGYQGYAPVRAKNSFTYKNIKNSFKNDLPNGYYATPIRKKSKADYADLQENDRVISINGKPVRNAARDVAMAYIDEADDALDLEIVRTRSANARMNQDKQTPAERRMSNGSNTVRKVTTTTTRIKTTKDGERLHETVTKTVTESMDGETPKTVSQTTSESSDLAGPVRKQIASTEHTAPIKVDRGRRTSDVTVTHPAQTQKPSFDRQRVSGNVTVGQPASITIQNPSKPGSWQQTQRHASPAKQQPITQQQPPSQRQPPRFNQPPSQPPRFNQPPSHPPRFNQPPPQPRFQQPQQQKPKPKFEMPKPSSNPRYQAPGPKADYAIQYGKPEPSLKSRKKPSYEPVSILQSKGSGKGAAVGRELTITFAMPDENKVDFGSPPESPSGMSVDSGVPPESPLTPKKHVVDDEEEEGDVHQDPSIILRSLAKDQPAKERLQRPFSEPAGRVTEEPEVSIVEKRRACKTIADLLMFPKNKQAKGARMFAKRRKRSARYTIEATGLKDSDEDSDGSSSGESGAAVITIKTGPPPPPPVHMTNGHIPAAPPPPPGGFTQRIKVEPTNFNVKLKSKEKCEHVAVSPKQCLVLADGLKGTSGRAAEMFEKRRLRSEQYVLDESTMKHPKPPPTFQKPPGPQNLRANAPPKKVSPWEAAQDSPVGCIAKAFPQKENKAPPPTVAKPKPPAAWMTTTDLTPQTAPKPPAEARIKPGFKAGRDLPKYPAHQEKESIPLKPGSKLPKANYKDFNTKPRGWGSRSSEDNTPGSPASLNSDQGSTGRGQIPTKPLKYSGGYNDFNPKPRSFGYDSPRHGALSPTTSLAESDDL